MLSTWSWVQPIIIGEHGQKSFVASLYPVSMLPETPQPGGIALMIMFISYWCPMCMPIDAWEGNIGQNRRQVTIPTKAEPLEHPVRLAALKHTWKLLKKSSSQFRWREVITDPPSRGKEVSCDERGNTSKEKAAAAVRYQDQQNCK